MKAFVVFLTLLCMAVLPATTLQAQAPAAQNNGALRTPEELDDLLGPIALYPDSLIALILPASTVPADVQQAAQFVNASGDPSQIQNQPWDDSVKALTRYPTVLNWMSQNIDWTTQLGYAFLDQPSDVMDSIQQLRAKAMAEGNLVNTPQQQVVVDNGEISIESANPDEIYVPQYDPDVVYDDPYEEGDAPFIDFSTGYPVGPWLNYGFDWRRRWLYTGDWHGAHDHHGHGGFGGNNGAAGQQWHPNAARVHESSRLRPANVAAAAVIRPKPLPGVTIPHGNRALQTGHVATPGLQTGNLNRNYTGWNTRPGTPVHNAPAVVAPPVALAPQNHVVFDAYGRGSITREESQRGQASRQPPAQVISRPVQVAPPQVVRPPVQTFAPVMHAAPIVHAAPVAPAFNMNAGAAAAAYGARGQQSRQR